MERNDPDRQDMIHCGAGVAANLVAMGVANWAGESTWQIVFTDRGRALARAAGMK